MNVLVFSGKMVFFRENMILFCRRKMKDLHSQKKTWENDTFYIFSKDGIPLFYEYDTVFLSKKQRLSFPEKIHLRMTLLISLKKMIFILENMIFFDRKIKDDQKV